jgi:predicted RNA-binding protein with PIN domain
MQVSGNDFQVPMAIHIIIDGYNMIRQSPELSQWERTDIQHGREALIDWLAAYRRRRPHKITVVFDGSNAPAASPRRDLIKGIAIRFSRGGETADAVIKRMARQEKEKALVVTSDREIIEEAASQGAATISSPEFEEKLVMAGHMGTDGMTADETDDKPSWKSKTPKKGPRRRLSKQKRRNKLKISKL